MGLLACVLVGIFVGWLVAAVQEVDEGILARMGIGAIGGVLGGLAIGLFAENGKLMIDVNWLSLLAGVIGASVLLGISKRASDFEHHGQ